MKSGSKRFRIDRCVVIGEEMGLMKWNEVGWIKKRKRMRRRVNVVK